ncbi:hypothetical protein K0M31_000139 [Melipona bicolor]|uniref:Uncharacterized protein n=1 Tax=Melipona bicolor TaxID=60889 RepID=A0AA40GCW7_9HYME|nr:hypothetical protein K0M31_000139 [Melipona bicolor]
MDVTAERCNVKEFPHAYALKANDKKRKETVNGFAALVVEGNMVEGSRTRLHGIVTVCGILGNEKYCISA